MLILQQTTPCFFAFHKRLTVCRVKTYVLRTRATQQEDDHPPNKQQDFQSSWDDHLKIQAKQADSYRPPAFKNRKFKLLVKSFLQTGSLDIMGESLGHAELAGHNIEEAVSYNLWSTCCKLEIAGCVAWRKGHRQWCCAIIRAFCNWSALVEIEPVLGIIVLALCVAAVWPSTVKTEEGKPKPGFFERIQNVSGRLHVWVWQVQSLLRW